MITTEHTPTGINERELTLEEIKTLAKKGYIPAIKELIVLRGGWGTLTPAQKEKVTQLILGFEVEL